MPNPSIEERVSKLPEWARERFYELAGWGLHNGERVAIADQRAWLAVQKLLREEKG